MNPKQIKTTKRDMRHTPTKTIINAELGKLICDFEDAYFERLLPQCEASFEADDAGAAYLHISHMTHHHVSLKLHILKLTKELIRDQILPEPGDKYLDCIINDLRKSAELLEKYSLSC